MRYPRYDWYPRDWQDDYRVRLLTLEERGAYRELLDHMWIWADRHETVDVPDHDRQFAAWLGVSMEHWLSLRAALIDGPDAPLTREMVDGNAIVYSKRLRQEYERAVKRTEIATAKAMKRHRPGTGTEEQEDSILSETDELRHSTSITPAELQHSTSRAPANVSSTHNHDQDQDHDQEQKQDQEQKTKDAVATQPAAKPRFSDDAKSLAMYLKKSLQARGVTIFSRDWHLKAAAKATTLLHDLSLEDCRALVDWCLADEFWGTRIANMDKVVDLAPQWQQQRSTGPPMKKLSIADQNQALLRRRMEALRQQEGG